MLRHFAVCAALLAGAWIVGSAETASAQYSARSSGHVRRPGFQWNQQYNLVYGQSYGNRVGNWYGTNRYYNPQYGRSYGNRMNNGRWYYQNYRWGY